MDPIWIASTASVLAALLAAGAAALAATTAFRPRDPALALFGDALDDLRHDLGTLRTALADDLRRGRDESGGHSRGLRDEIGQNLDRLGVALDATLQRSGTLQAEKAGEVATAVRTLAETTERRLADMRRDGDEGGKALREEVTRQLQALGLLLGGNLEGAGETQRERLDEVAGAIRRLVASSQEANEALRATVEGRLEVLRQDNAAKLEEMRRTVDEKLQGTLEERLGEKFKIVGDHLEQVHRSVGEMQALATGVGDLKRVLVNVKSRGTWGEVSLGNLLDQVLAPDQFARNVETVRGSGERIEYAVRLPGGAEGDTLWLPIDAKFPAEDYDRLTEASERGDAPAVEAALKGLETRIKAEGAKICGKYVSPPQTTDFAILYLPTEGLYAEVLRRPGLVDHLQGRCRIMVAGPTNLHALLTSLRMGFRTLAIEKRSSEVWTTLSEVKREFGKYGDVLDAVKKKLAEAAGQIDKAAVRTRAIDRTLAGVELAPEAGTLPLAPLSPKIGLLDAAE